jgi:hypothetical protein
MKLSTLVWILLLIALVVGAYFILGSGPKAAPNDNDLGGVEDSEDSDSSDQEAEVSTTHFDYIMPDDWAHTARAEADISKFLDPDQRIEFGVIEVGDTAYFSTTATNDDTNTLLTSIYKYNSKDYTFERIWKTSSSPVTFSTPVYRALGIDKGSLILLKQGVDDSPGPCTQPLLLTGGDRAILALNLESPYSGLKTYTIPQDARAAAEAAQTACLAENEIN